MDNSNVIATLRNLGYKDYIAARVLLNRGYFVQGATLASTAVEKYLKIPISINRKCPKVHLSDLETFRRAYADIGEDLSTWIQDNNFLEVLSNVYRIRYYDKLPGPISVGCFPEQLLGELDHTIAMMETNIIVTDNETGAERPTPYKHAVATKEPDLYENNYLLTGLDKTEYMQRPYKGYCLYVDTNLYGCEVLIQSAPIRNPYSGIIHYIQGQDSARG